MNITPFPPRSRYAFPPHPPELVELVFAVFAREGHLTQPVIGETGSEIHPARPLPRSSGRGQRKLAVILDRLLAGYSDPDAEEARRLIRYTDDPCKCGALTMTVFAGAPGTGRATVCSNGHTIDSTIRELTPEECR